jgi:beta-lactamase superfamily II metal-dependent hydrolase
MRRREKHKRMLKEAAEAKLAKKEAASVEKKPKINVVAQKEDWKVGEVCQAFWYEDRKFYKAKIRQTSKKNKNICVTFMKYGNSVVLKASQLLTTGTEPTKEMRQQAYFVHVEDSKVRKAAAKAKKEKALKEKMRKRAARR